MVNIFDFNRHPEGELNGKCLYGLLDFYQKRCGSLAEALKELTLKELKRTIGIEDLTGQPYRDFKEALEALRARKISWKRATPDIQKEFVNALARELCKEPGMLTTADFAAHITLFNGVTLRGLVLFYNDQGKYKSVKKALGEMKRALGIIPMSTPPYLNFEEARAALASGNIAWKRVPLEMQREFVSVLATERGLELGALTPHDLRRPVAKFGEKSLVGLLASYDLNGKRAQPEALKELKKAVGIADLSGQPYKDFAEARKALSAKRISPKAKRMSWRRTTPEMRQEFIKILAEQREKEPGKVSTYDLQQPMPELNGRNLKGLYKRETESASSKYSRVLYQDFDEALEAFRAGAISWKRTTPAIQKRFIEVLAERRGKAPGMLETRDFIEKIEVFGRQNLGSLLAVYARDKSVAEGIIELKKAVGIEDLLTPLKGNGNRNGKNRKPDIVVKPQLYNPFAYLIEKGKNGGLSQEEEVFLFEAVRRGDTGARDTAIAAHFYLVKNIARKYGRWFPSIEEEAFVSIGSRALVESVDRFDLQREYGFRPFSIAQITRRMHQYARGAIKKGSGREIPVSQLSKNNDEFDEVKAYTETMASIFTTGSFEQAVTTKLLLEKFKRILEKGAPNPQLYVAVFTLRCQGKTMREIQQELGLSRGCANNISSQGIKIIRGAIGKRPQQARNSSSLIAGSVTSRNGI